jgi:type IV secretory pathway VirB9-like protein
MRVRSALAIATLLVCGLIPIAAQSGGVRDVTASERSVIPLHTRIRFTTMVLLPDGEEILDVVCGDRDFWVISATQNIAHIKPAKEGASTNLNLVTSQGTVYSFLLTEGKTPEPDLKLYVTADPQAPRATPKFVSVEQVASQVNTLESQLKDARAAADAARHQGDEAIAALKQQYPRTLQFVYGSPKYSGPFFVRAIWHDGRFTYIQTDARELPALYEMKDGQPSLVDFQVHGATYVVPKVLDSAYLALGKQKWSFRRER